MLSATFLQRVCIASKSNESHAFKRLNTNVFFHAPLDVCKLLPPFCLKTSYLNITFKLDRTLQVERQTATLIMTRTVYASYHFKVFSVGSCMYTARTHRYKKQVTSVPVFNRSPVFQCRYILLTTKKLDCNKFIILDIEIPGTESYLGNEFTRF